MQQSSDFYRMRTFNMALVQMVRDRVIREEVVLGASTNPGDLWLMIKGVQKPGFAPNR